MCGPVAVLQIASLLASLNTSAQLSLRGENRVGRFQSAGTDDLSSRVDFELTPGISARAVNERTLLSADYRPELLVGSRVGATPAVLHTAGARIERRLGHTAVLRFASEALSGPLDHGQATRVLGETGTLPAFPDSETMSYANADVFAALVLQSTRRLTLESTLTAGYTGPSPGEAETLVLTQRRALVSLSAAYKKSRRTTVGAQLHATVVDFENGPRYAAVGPMLRMSYHSSRNNELALRLGAEINRRTDAPEGTASGQPNTKWQPVGGATITSMLGTSRGGSFHTELSADLAPSYDPFEGTLVARSVFGAGIHYESRGLNAAARFRWYEPVSRMGGTDEAPLDARDYRMTTMSLVVTKALNEAFGLEAGSVGMWRGRGSAEVFGSVDLSRPEVLLYLAMTARAEIGR